jgi:hypothetical protein
LVQEAGRGEVGAVMGDLEGSKCTSSLCMDHTFWDSLACEMRQTLEKLGVLQQDETSARVIS